MLKLLQGTNRADRANPAEPKPHGDLVEPPAYFGEEERQVWGYAMTHAPKGLLKMIDSSHMEVWVNALVAYRIAGVEVKNSGQTISAANGATVINPAMSIQNRQAILMMRAATDMGFTPSSRSRIVLIEETPLDNPFAKFKVDY
ncbi:phage terminase small subunit P27 family [Polynucleobacter sp. CS-Odin-A6]|uniref:phage terminase small subunit P27 family n=1 Tax=Polynucleobacter sp. CS-Odin-A6 TaxID=2689106 RepID=UPI001C0C58FE|nr:phage terminase small subunit P27 family [Polynucleobacter sp. CS-Odin-A6]MBU3620921.1 phage terminase small subunit P27 family [Polynucleobacter sp. CS-Odin-A6]